MTVLVTGATGLLGSHSRARHELGFAPQVTLAEGVRRSIAWYRTTCEQGRRAYAPQEI